MSSVLEDLARILCRNDYIKVIDCLPLEKSKPSIVAFIPYLGLVRRDPGSSQAARNVGSHGEATMATDARPIMNLRRIV